MGKVLRLSRHSVITNVALGLSEAPERLMALYHRPPSQLTVNEQSEFDCRRTIHSLEDRVQNPGDHHIQPSISQNLPMQTEGIW